jgi:uncharacterized YigZ family protein
MHELHEKEFLTISQPSQGLFKDRGSKFFGFAFPFEDENRLKEIIENLKREHHNARHFCFAYRVNPRNIAERANDDGEPNHSAGTPILGQIHSAELVNILVVVVRYFGGTKLGVPGLINAYKSAARMAIENGEIVKEDLESSIKFSFDYAEMNEVMRVIKKTDVRIINQKMGLHVEMELRIREDKISDLKSHLELLKSLTFKP